jgi:hypothetical protein
MRRVGTLRTSLLAGGLLLTALSLACFRVGPVVQHHLEILFHADGAFEIGVTTRISADAYESNSEAVRRRVTRVAEAILRGDDIWSQAIRALQPQRERRVQELSEGRLIEAFRQALVEQPERFGVLFEAIPVRAYLEREEDLMTLDLVPTGGNRATARQERRVLEHLDRFSRGVATHVRDAAALYAYLEENPERTRPVLIEMFGLEIEEDGESGEVTEEETRLLKQIEEGASIPLEILEFEEEEAYTLDELSQLVFNPFPASIEIEISGSIEEMTGFRSGADGRAVLPAIGFWNAFVELEARWVSPLPLVAHIEAVRRSEDAGVELDDADFLEAFLARPPVVRGIPGPEEVREALEEALGPEDLYRLGWRLPELEE